MPSPPSPTDRPDSADQRLSRPDPEHWVLWTPRVDRPDEHLQDRTQSDWGDIGNGMTEAPTRPRRLKGRG